MIPNRTESVDVINNIDADATGQFTVDENSLAKIMSVLTNLYSDPELAVVREYLTNALDAQIEAQEKDPNYVWRPIEVTTPSHFMKEYKVRDFGIGMSVDDIKDIYSKYGKSTKEQSNAVTGMLGLGSKCALTYTGQFTITGYKNGVRTRAVVSKDDNDIPVFMIVDTRATTEPNGVEISVPVRDRNTFAEKTRDFLRWWKPGQVLVNGGEPTHHNFKMVKNDPMSFNIGGVTNFHTTEIYLIENENGYNYNVPQSYVIMGNVPYQVDAEYVDEGLRNARLGFAAYVPMGAVDFPPSREKLFYNNRSKAAVKQISSGLFDLILKQKLDEVKNAKTHVEAWNAYHSLPHHFSSHPTAQNLTYKGLGFTSQFKHEHVVLDWDWQGHGQVSERTYMNVGNEINGALIVTGVPAGTKPTSYFKKKARHYMQVNSISGAHAILTDKDVDNRWLDHLPRIDVDTIKDIKLPKNPSNSGPRQEAPYDYYTWDATTSKTGIESDVNINVPAGKTLCYISPQDMRETYRKQGGQPEMLVRLLGEDYILAVMGKNRFDKFKRSYPNAISASKAVQDVINKYVAASTNAEYVIGQLSYGEQEFLKNVSHKDILDDEIVELAKFVQAGGTATNYKKAETLNAYARRCDIISSLPAAKANVVNPCKRYPLMDAAGGRQLMHMVIYINAVYKQNNP